ncbi:unnamed protein product [Nippostrongylus brasiliensis]|uniref:DNA repair protein complementing XP-C cells (inferred by orthology to a human protein) n=1 Tax=Nippostrongylus brasiliensis TaxID=27835 RepID=A0A158R0S6_NIPBR|nr:unnamed protein product [Nippostrongylus brasiliensis]
MVSTRRRSQPLSVSPAEVVCVPVNKTIKKKAEVKKSASKSSSPVLEAEKPKQGRKRGDTARDDPKEVAEKKGPKRRSLPAMKAPAVEKRLKMDDEMPTSRGSRGKRKRKLPENDVQDELKIEPKEDETMSEEKVKEEPVETKPDLDDDVGSGEWENFGNTSDESGDESEPESRKKKTKVKSKKKVTVESKKAQVSPTRRSERNVKRKSYVMKKDDDEGSLSSSSSSADDSEDKDVSEASLSEAEDSADEASSVTRDSEESDASFIPKASTKKAAKGSTKKSGGGGGGRGGGKTMAPSKGARRENETITALNEQINKYDLGVNHLQARGNLERAKVYVPGAPAATKTVRPFATKPPKPWQKVNEPVMQGDIVVPPRALRRGEKKMLKFRIFAAALSIGRNFEMNADESERILDQMRAEEIQKRAVQMAPETLDSSAETNEECSSSEDEWEDMLPADPSESQEKQLQVTLQKAEEKDWWALYLRQEVNKCVRENWENAHKMNILCYIAHLQFLKKVILEENLVPSLMLTKMPSGYQSLVGEVITIENAQRILKWYHSAFRASGSPIKFEPGLCRYDATARYSEMVAQQEYENDADRAASVLKDIEKMKKTATPPATAEPSNPKGKGDLKKRKSSTGGSDTNYKGVVRNYWVEYWDRKQKRWICVDPLRSSVDDPNSIEENLSKPVVYVLAIDSEGGVREVTARYASDFSRPDFRRRRTEQAWIVSTLKAPMIRANRERALLEDTHMKQELVKKPLPATLSEYVLEKDLLKFEGIYPRPEEQKPLGEVRGHKVYPRSTVYTLQSANNWIKMARSVKEGEKAYKVVKARPNLKVPAEEREDRFLDVFGYWQTEPMEGACVLEEDAEKFINEWKRLEATREERENKSRSKKKKGVKEEDQKNNAVIDKTVMGTRQVFTHDDLMNLKH